MKIVKIRRIGKIISNTSTQFTNHKRKLFSRLLINWGFKNYLNYFARKIEFFKRIQKIPESLEKSDKII